MVLYLANVKMANAVRLVSVREGHDPRDFALVAFGGAGPLHACAVAEEIGATHVVVPRFPGAFSAFGLLSANLRRDFVHAWPNRLSAIDDARLRRELADFRAAVADEMNAIAKGRPVSWDVRADVRYVGQASELIVSVDDPDAASLATLGERFRLLHQRRTDRPAGDDLPRRRHAVAQGTALPIVVHPPEDDDEVEDGAV